MTGLAITIPIAIVMGLGALAAFLWALRSGQYEDMEGAGQRILDDEDEPRPR
ncbi:MAG: cbb3-type cytochrome oxidase assembly protein CcoS [Devosia sp.]